MNLTDADKAALAALLRDMIAADRFPLSPRIRRLRAILAKLEPAAPAAETLPAPKPPVQPSIKKKPRLATGLRQTLPPSPMHRRSYSQKPRYRPPANKGSAEGDAIHG